MLCNLCNSWFHLIAECEDDLGEDSGPSEQTSAEKQHDQDEYAAAFFAQVAKQRSTYYYTGCIQQFDAPGSTDMNYSAYKEEKEPDTPFLSICVDQEATDSIYGKRQYEAYLRTIHNPSSLRTLKPSSVYLRFGGRGSRQLILPSSSIAVIRILGVYVTYRGYRHSDASRVKHSTSTVLHSFYEIFSIIKSWRLTSKNVGPNRCPLEVLSVNATHIASAKQWPCIHIGADKG